jgi:hypothetical protein
MSAPPCFLRVKITEQERTKCRLWLPLFILWPLLLVLVLLALIVALFVDGVVVLTGSRPGYTRLVIGVLQVLGASRGVEISVHDEKHTVALTVN